MKEGCYMLAAAVVGWLLAQLIKLVVLLVQQHGAEGLGWKTILKTSMRSGGMPSGHTACLAAVTAFLGLRHGLDSELFALALVMLAIVAYDAVNVRWAVGEHGKMLKELVRKRFRVVEGHTVAQVLIGLVLGVAVGVGTFMVWKLMNGGFVLVAY